MSAFDLLLSRVPFLGRAFGASVEEQARSPDLAGLLRATSTAAAQGRDDVVRHLLRALDVEPTGSSRGSWLSYVNDQPYETDADLLGDRLPWEIRRIITTDTKVAMAVRATVQTALTATFSFKPGRDTPLARELAAQSNQDFGFGASPRMDRPFAEVLEEAMFIGPAVGFCYHEAGYALRQVDGRLRWLLSDYHYRPPEAHQRFEHMGDRFIGVRQRAAGSAGECLIPAHKLLLLGYGAAADNLWGSGWARAAYPWVVLKQHFTELLAVNGEREALGGLYVTVDKLEAERHGYSAPQLTEMIKKAKKAAAQWSQGAISWLLSFAGIKFEQLPGRFNPVGAIAVIAQCNQEILAAFVGASLLEIGVVQPGNRAIGEIFSSMLTDNVATVLDQIARRLGGRLGPGRGTATRVHDVNLGRDIDPADYPRAVHTGLRPSELGKALGQLPALRAAGLITGTDKLEAEILAAVGVVMDEAARRTVAERLGVANNDVPNLGPAGTPDGAPASPEAVAAAAQRMGGELAEGEDAGAEAAPTPARNPAAYTARNRDAAAMLNVSAGLLSTLVQRGQAQGISPPTIGAGAYRRWDPSQLADWYDQVAAPPAREAAA